MFDKLLFTLKIVFLSATKQVELTYKNSVSVAIFKAGAYVDGKKNAQTKICLTLVNYFI